MDLPSMLLQSAYTPRAGQFALATLCAITSGQLPMPRTAIRVRMAAMPHRRYHVGPPWPPRLSAYDYVRVLHKLDCAWEVLRRNAAYHDDWSNHRRAPIHPTAHPSGVSLQRSMSRCPSAERWGLCTFR